MPNPRKRERKDNFIGRCIGELVKEGYSKSQSAAICYVKWNEKLYSTNKVGLDFDDTLETEAGQALYKRLVADDYEVYIVTRRQRDTMSKAVFDLAKKLGIPRDHIFFTNGKMKYEKVAELQLMRFYDNNPEEIARINENTECRGILFKK